MLPENWISQNCVQLPENSICGVVNSSVYSFTISCLISGGDPLAGLTGVGLGTLAKTTEVALLAAFKKLQRSPNLGEDTQKLAFLAGFAASLAVGDLSHRTSSVFFTLPCYFLHVYRNNVSTPIGVVGNY
jgi:hypothetical protein